MTLKEQLEILRGEPIQLKAPIEDIPCIETSDAEKLCKHPVVSVHMITYNHEPYIRQAIEGVMMQQTDFEFELIIGEDASQDKTREICFEYQKKHPDKIRVLWSEKNVNHLGGNGRRVTARCRGEFIALCEGDDYWTDPLKLQKQVDIMRANPDVGLCFCGAKIYRGGSDFWEVWNDGFAGFSPGKISSLQYVLWTMFGKNPKRNPGPEFFVMTATLLFRRAIYNQAVEKYDIFKWRLYIGDATLCLGVGSLASVYYLSDNVSVYRQMSTGLTLSGTGNVRSETYIVRLYFLSKLFHWPIDYLPSTYKKILVGAMLSSRSSLVPIKQNKYIRRFFFSKPLIRLCLSPFMFPITCLLLLGCMNSLTRKICYKHLYWTRWIKFVPKEVRVLYAKALNEV